MLQAQAIGNRHNLFEQIQTKNSAEGGEHLPQLECIELIAFSRQQLIPFQNLIVCSTGQTERRARQGQQGLARLYFKGIVKIAVIRISQSPEFSKVP